MATNGSESKDKDSKRETGRLVYEFFVNPVAVFALTIGLAILVSQIQDRVLQFFGILTIGTVYALGSLIYAALKTRFSIRELRISHVRLESDIKELRSQHEILKQEKGLLEKEVPKVIQYGTVHKRIVILNKEGDGEFSMTYEGTNISGTPLNRVRYMLNTEQKLTEDKVKNCTFNSAVACTEIRNYEIRDARNNSSNWRNYVALDGEEPVPNNGFFRTHYEAKLSGEYAKAFGESDGAETNHEVAFRTDRFIVEVIAPKGWYFSSPKYSVKDAFNDIEIHKEEDRILNECAPSTVDDRGKMLWKIDNPRVCYRYALLFLLRERKPLTEEKEEKEKRGK